jgi:hypothetical protein
VEDLQVSTRSPTPIVNPYGPIVRRKLLASPTQGVVVAGRWAIERTPITPYGWIPT